MNGFFEMGGYAAYIWPAYGVSALGVGAAIVWSWLGWRAVKARLANLEGKS